MTDEDLKDEIDILFKELNENTKSIPSMSDDEYNKLILGKRIEIRKKLKQAQKVTMVQLFNLYQFVHKK